MFEMGMFVALGLIVIFIKLPWRGRLMLLSHPVKVDVVVFISLCVLHGGTFSGVMVATIGAFLVSLCLSLGRWMFGYMAKGKHVVGKFGVQL